MFRLIILPQLVAELELDKKRASFLRSLLRASYHTPLLLRKTLSVDMTDILSAIICFGDTPRKRIPSTSYILVVMVATPIKCFELLRFLCLNSSHEPHHLTPGHLGVNALLNHFSALNLAKDTCDTAIEVIN